MSLQSSIINNRYILGEKLGSGSFGTIYLGTDNRTNKNVALKLESMESEHQQLLKEKSIYKKLKGSINNGIPEIYEYFSEYELSDGTYNILVMELVGTSLEDLFDKCDRKFSLKTTLQLAIQIIKRIQYIHQNSFIHRDIKPDNFVFNNKTLYAIDFGLSKYYINPKTNNHISFRDDKSLTGTPRYASINAHLGCEQSRRDDLEAIGYVLVYFLNGKLPWQGIKAATKKKKYRKIMEMKKTTSIHSLCKRLPDELILYFQYVRNLKFTDTPDYDYLIKLFKQAAYKNNIMLDDYYDWNIKINDKQTDKQTDTLTLDDSTY
jgi:casein kinase 1